MAASDWENGLGALSPESGSSPPHSSRESSPVADWIEEAKKQQAEMQARRRRNQKSRSQSRSRSRRQCGGLQTSLVSPTMSLSPSDSQTVTHVELEQMYKDLQQKLQSSVEMHQTLQELNASKNDDIETLKKQLHAMRCERDTAQQKLKKV